MRSTRLGDVVTVKSGFAFKSADWLDAGVPVIKIANVKDGWVTLDSCSFVSEEVAHSARAFELTRGDVLISMTGHIGQVAKVRDEGRMLLNQRVGRFSIKKRDRINAEYLFQWLRLPEVRAVFEAHAYGAAQPNISPSLIEQQSIPIPLLPVQIRIASILSAYDDLIENNTRRIAILEEMARRIYKEWFVRFRFPGHEGVRMVESELGLMPEGWKIEAVEDVTETLGGGTPSKAESEYWDGGHINWYSPTDLTGARTVFMEESTSKITALGLAKGSAKLFPASSVMMTSRATLGVIAVNTTPACTNQGFIVCLPSDRMPLWLLFHWLKANESEFEGRATGATFKEITKGVFRKIKLAVPAIPIAAAFEDVVGPMMDLVLRLERKNRILRTTRDLLLPKLISGELDVSATPVPQALFA